MSARPAAVIDTNVLVSGLIGHPHGPSTRILNAWRQGRFVLVTSESLLSEFKQVTLRNHISQRINPRHLAELWRTIRSGATVVTPISDPLITCDDPDDVVLFSTAVAGSARWIVTGDGVLLDLVRVHGIEVVSPRAFLSALPTV